MEKLICIYSGPIGGDCTSNRLYKPSEPMTVRELCEYILSNKDEWGYIGINDTSGGYFRASCTFGNPKIEYWHGNYCNNKREPIELDFSEEILNSYIKKIDWSGGYTRADWLITLE